MLFALLLLLELRLVLSPSPERLSRIPFLAKPQFMQIQLARRMWASFSIGISQLAGVWGTPTPSEATMWKQAKSLLAALSTESQFIC